MIEKMSRPKRENLPPQFEVIDAIRAASSANEGLKILDTYFKMKGPKALSPGIFPELFSKIDSLADADAIIATLKERYSLLPDETAAPALIQKSGSFESAVEILRHFQNKHGVLPDKYSFVALAQRGTPEEALEAVANFKNKGDVLPEAVLIHLLPRANDLEHAERVLQAVTQQYSVKITHKSFAQLIHTAKDMDEAQRVIAHFQQLYGLSPDESVLEKIVGRINVASAAERTADILSKQYNVPLTSRTAQSILNAVHDIPYPEECLNRWKEKYNYKPDLYAYQKFLIKALQTINPDARSLLQIRNLIRTISSAGGDVETSPQLTKARGGILYARYLFLDDKPLKAIAIIQPLLQKRNTKDTDKIMAASMIFAFLPQEHPLRMAVFDSLRKGRAKGLLDQALRKANNFSAAFGSWLQEGPEYYGNSVFDALHASPINQQAADAVFFPKKET